MSVFAYDKDSDGIVTITMDMTGPVNAMNAEFDEAFEETVGRLAVEQGLTGVIFASAKKTFFAGGDLNFLVELEPGSEASFYEGLQHFKHLVGQLEQMPVPVVAAINGAAMGGGFELCLGCNYRIAWNNPRVQVGLPEVDLGLMPAGGGVVRMVNLLGLEKSLPYVLEGIRVGADKARAEGLVDELVEELDDLVPAAKRYILANRDNPEAAVQPWRRKGFRIPGGSANDLHNVQLVTGAPVMLRKKTRGNLPAPESILNVWTEASRIGFDAAMRLESRELASLVTTPVAKNMITTFFFGMQKVNGLASRPKSFPESTVKKVGVVGAGMMGQGIANVSAMAGIEVVLRDVSLEAAERGKAYTEKLMDKRIARGQADQAKKDAVLSLITATDKVEDLAGCDLIIEAVFEKLDVKHQVTKEAEPQLAENGVWGTNTSTLPITRLAEASVKPENFIGLHFFSPVDRMPMLEIICGEKTSDETLARAFDYAKQIRKTPIVVNDRVGFFTSRTFATQLNEALSMVADGVHPILVENGSKAIGMPAGSCTLLDEISYDLGETVRKTHTELGLVDPANDPTPQATAFSGDLVEMGRLGRKVGKGIFDWDESGKKLSQEVVDKYYREEVSVPMVDIKDRLLFRPVIESLKCLEEGVLCSFADGNVGSILGIAAPAWTGGYLQFVNTYGLDRFIARCEELAEKYGDRFAPPAIVREKAAAGELIS